MSNKIEKEIKEYYDNQNIPEIKKDNFVKLKVEMDKSFEKNRKFNRWKFATISLCSILILLISISIPFIIKYVNNDKYYSENGIIQNKIELNETRIYINENINQLNFIFDECQILYSYGYFDKDNKLLALSINIEKNDIPFTNTTIDIVINKKYQFKMHETYTTNATITNHLDCTIYEKLVTNNNEEYKYVLIDKKEYSIYLKLNIDDIEFIEKFY